MLGTLSLAQISVLLVQFCNSEGAGLACAPQWWLLGSQWWGKEQVLQGLIHQLGI